MEPKGVLIDNITDKATTLNTRSVSLDAIKLISALMVVFFHFNNMNLGTFTNEGYRISFEQLCLCLCSASIPLFFMVNGALLFNKTYSIEKIYSKAGKAALLVFVWEFTSFPSWFMKTLVVLFLIYPILNKMDKAKNKLWRNLTMLIIFLFPFVYNFVIVCLEKWWPDFSVGIAGCTMSLDVLPLRTGLFTMYSVLYFMLGGILMRHKINNIVSIVFSVVGYGLVLFDVIVTSNYNMEIQDAVNGNFPTIGTLFLSIGLFNLLRNLDRINNARFKKVVIILGRGVLSIYLFHMLIIYRVFYYLIPSESCNIVVVLISAIAVCLICWLIDFLLKKVPLVRELLKL